MNPFPAEQTPSSSSEQTTAAHNTSLPEISASQTSASAASVPDVFTPNASVPDAAASDAAASGAAASDAVVVQRPALWRQVLDSLAFALSAILSPYLVIPFGTVGIVATQARGRRDFVLWTFLSVFFSTIVPALYVLVQIVRGKITDVHVMEREQRGGPFLVAVVSVAVGAFVLRAIGAPAVVWGIGLVLLVNGLVLSWITKFWKISMHVSVLTSVVIACIILIPKVSFWSLAWMIPALMWARAMRGRHSPWQGIGGFLVSGALTLGVFAFVKLWPMVEGAVHRLLVHGH